MPPVAARRRRLRSGAGDHDAGEILDRPGAALMDRVHREHPDCDAVFFVNDDLAQGAVFQCARLGLAVPGRIGLVGFHDLAGSAWTTPPLSTIATPRYEIGLAAAGLLMRHLAGEAIERRHVDLGFELVRRQTT
ncbi:substrate-binding domain-containing protein [Achromobacter xylosoxidans]